MVRSRLVAALAALLVVPATTLVVAAPAEATLPATPSLSLERVLRTTPFAGGGEVDDVEGVAYVARDDALWLADDNGNAIYEVDATTGVLRRTIGVSSFGAVRPLGGGAPATLPRYDDLESLAYDTVTDRLYVFSGSCCTSAVLPTAYRMSRGSSGRLELDSYQPLAAGTEFTAAGWNPADGKLYVGSGEDLRVYDYVSNTSSAPFGIDGVDGILGLDFTDDGRDLFVAHSSTHVTRVSWASRTRVPGWNLDLEPYDVLDARGVEVVSEQLWVPDGYGERPDGDELDRAVFVFDVGAEGPPPPPPPPPLPAAPTAAFGVSAVTGTAPLTVSFTDTSTGGPTSWTWDFGDGTSATTAHPTHTYASPGTYTARLTVANAGGASSTTRSIVVNAPLVTPPSSGGGGPAPSPSPVELVGNPGFESGLDGWRTGRAGARLTRVRGGHSGAWAARVASRGERRTVELDDAPGWAPTTRAGTYTATVWVRSKDIGAEVVLRLDERRSGDRIGTARTVRRLPRGWTKVQVTYVPRAPGTSRLDLTVVLHGQRPTTWFKADDVRLSVS